MPDASLPTPLPWQPRRCERHSLALSPEGECIRCRREARRARTQRWSIWASLLAAATLASGVGLLSRTSARAAEQSRAPQGRVATPGGSRVDPFMTGPGGQAAEDATGARVEEPGERLALGSPPPGQVRPPVVIQTGMTGMTPEERDRLFAENAAERATNDAQKAAAAQAVLEGRLAAEDRELRALQAGTPAMDTPSRALQPPPRDVAPSSVVRHLKGRRHCGCNGSGFQFIDL